ncbi:hypothetical protein B7495_11045 [Cryobacterium sp. LW097]|uniref:hypothetical protein n=1 Tax=Cryobacterium sp. LW097 TaxID=1978566 RepID=UPI000B4D42AD|nr:hypothetical protein [Cryobacterium sp. LW097]ASD22556.1 hypothetical protein B7495_11045 [Cryobacterium sp. LW097]
MAISTPAEDNDSRARAGLMARAAPTVGDAIARAHATSLREAGADSAQSTWIQHRLDRELEAARAALHRALEDETSRNDALQLAELFELCRIWRTVDPEFAEHEAQITHELTHTHGISIQPKAQARESTQVPPERTLPK